MYRVMWWRALVVALVMVTLVGTRGMRGVRGTTLIPAGGVQGSAVSRDALAHSSLTRGADILAAASAPFERNVGQTDPRVMFLARGKGYTVFLTSAEAVLALAAPTARDVPATGTAARGRRSGDVVRFHFVGASAHARVIGLDRAASAANYLIGRDPRRWRTGVPTYGRVAYRDLYRGVTLVYYATGGQLEYDYVLAPGADPATIKLGVWGARALRLDAAGNLVLRLTGGEVREDRPVVYQQVGARRQLIPGRYVLLGRDTVGFAIGAYDARRPLVIDPTLSYSTYLGGSADNSGASIAVDGAGNAYVVGDTTSTDFPTTAGAYATTLRGASDAFVTKLNMARGAPVYSTYLGGGDIDVANGVAIDGSGRAYVVGTTSSTDFPTTTGAYSSTNSGGADAFVAELNAAGNGLLYSTYLGGSDTENGTGIALDASNMVYVTGATASPDFPTTAGAFSTAYGGGDSVAFVAKVDPAQNGRSSLVYGTYLGGGLVGSGSDQGSAIAVDAGGQAYVTGSTTSTNFPTTTGAHATANAGGSDAFVTALSASGAVLVYSTYLGGSQDDVGQGIALDAGRNAYVTGYTLSGNFPLVNPLPRGGAPSGGADAFVTEVNPTGSALVYSTYLGGSGDDAGVGIAVDAGGSAYVTGSTTSLNFPTTADANATSTSGGSDAFVARLGTAGNTLLYGTYLGGSGDDAGRGIAVDGAGNAYVVGQTFSADFPTVNAPQNGNNGDSSAFVAELSNASGQSTPSPTISAPLPTSTNTPVVPGATSTKTPVIPGATSTSTPRTVATTAATAVPTTGAGTGTSTPVLPSTVGGTTTASAASTPTRTMVSGAAQATVPPAQATEVATAVPPMPSVIAGLPPNSSRPAIALTPGTTVPGATVTVLGGGFVPGETVTLALNGAALDTRPGIVVADRTGHFTATFVAPNGLLSGANTVSAIGTRGGISTAATLIGRLAVASRFFLAGGQDGAGTTAQLQLLNPTGGSATAHLTVYYTDGTVRRATLTLPARMQRTVSVAQLTGRTGQFGLALTATRQIAAQLKLTRPGRDGDAILANTGLGTRWYLAEGYTGLTFHETVAILNPNPSQPAYVAVRLLALGGRGSRTVSLAVAAHSESVVDVSRLLRGRSLSVVATSDRGVVVERTLTFSRDGRGAGYGLTTRAGTNVAATSWLFAEGTTVNHFETYLTILNPGATAARVTARFYGRAGKLLGSRTLTVAGLSRGNIRLNGLVHASGIASVVMAERPVIVERPEYFGSPNGTRVAGSDVFGLNGGAPRWSFAGGVASGTSEFLLLYNPSPRAVGVTATFYGADGRLATARVTIAAHGRATLDVRRAAPGLAGLHGVTLAADGGQGFVAEQTVFAPNLSTLDSTQGFAQ